MKHTIGCTTRPYGSLTFSEACDHIAAAGYTDVAVFANAGQVPVRADSTDAEIAETRKAAAAAGLSPFNANRQYEIESWLGSRCR